MIHSPTDMRSKNAKNIFKALNLLKKKGEIKNILLQIDRINYKPESPLQESLEVRPGAFYFL